MDFVGVIIDFIQKESYKIIGNLSVYVTNLLYILCMIDLIFNVSFNILEPKSNPFVELAYNCFKYSFFGYIVNNYSKVLEIVIGGGIQLGNMALGKGSNTYFTTELFEYIYKYIQFAFDLFGVIVTTATITDLAFIESIPTASVFFLLAILIFTFWTLVKVIMTIGKVFLISAFSYPLLPFAVFTRTKDIGMKAFSSVINCGIFMFVLTTLLNMCQNVQKIIDEFYPVDPNLSFAEAMSYSVGKSIFTAFSSFIVIEFVSNSEIIAGMISSGVLSTLKEGGKGVTSYYTDSKNMSNYNNKNKSETNNSNSPQQQLQEIDKHLLGK